MDLAWGRYLLNKKSVAKRDAFEILNFKTISNLNRASTMFLFFESLKYFVLFYLFLLSSVNIKAFVVEKQWA